MVNTQNTSVPRVSIVLPVHNGARYLGLAIDSLLAQTLGDFELLLLDDGSSDDSLAIARTYAARDPRVQVHALTHRGLSAILNDGLRLARAPLIARMDSDDIAWPERLARQVSFLDAHPHIALVGGNVRFMDEAGAVRPADPLPCTPSDLKSQMLFHNVLVHPTVVMRACEVFAVGGYRLPFALAEDYDLWLRMEERSALANLPDVVLDFRRHSANVSSRFGVQQAINALAARASALGRRTSGRDPIAGFIGTIDLAMLEAIELPAAVRSQWIALAFLTIARHGAAADPDLLAWTAKGAYAALAVHRSDAIVETIARAHLTLARTAWFGGDRLGALEQGRRALRIAPRAATRRALRYARARLKG